jgi:hypothetical protein
LVLKNGIPGGLPGGANATIRSPADQDQFATVRDRHGAIAGQTIDSPDIFVYDHSETAMP